MHFHAVFQNTRPLRGLNHKTLIFPTRRADSKHPQVDIGRQAAIQLQLSFAVPAAFFQLGLINEPQIDRLFELVHPLTTDQDHRDMRFDALKFGFPGVQALGVPLKKRNNLIKPGLHTAQFASPAARLQ